MLWSFDLIGDFLVWKVGNGESVRIGMDPWVGCKWRNMLPPHLIDKLHSAGIYFSERYWMSRSDLFNGTGMD